MSLVRTLTVDDDLALSRVGYERGEVLVPDTGSAETHRYRVDTTSSLVADGLVLLEASYPPESPDRPAYRLLDTNRSPLSVRDLRRFRILRKVAEPAPTAVPGSSGGALPDAPAELAELRADALDNDLLDGVDFAVVGASASMGDECIVLEPGADGYAVGYRDGGGTRGLFTSRALAQARAVFLDEACWLGAERGRGSYVGRSQAVGTEDWTPTQVVAAYERRLLGES